MRAVRLDGVIADFQVTARCVRTIVPLRLAWHPSGGDNVGRLSW
jgi:hypothetical protein